MDKDTTEQHLAQARVHVSQGEQHIARQREIVFSLQVEGKDDSEALRLLDNFIELQTMHVADVERLQRELAFIA